MTSKEGTAEWARVEEIKMTLNLFFILFCMLCLSVYNVDYFKK